MSTQHKDLSNAIRFLSIDAVEKADRRIKREKKLKEKLKNSETTEEKPESSETTDENK